jgi:hypothetical protein
MRALLLFLVAGPCPRLCHLTKDGAFRAAALPAGVRPPRAVVITPSPDGSCACDDGRPALTDGGRPFARCPGQPASGRPGLQVRRPFRPAPQRGPGGAGGSIARTLACLLLSLWLALVGASPAVALLQASPGETGTGLVRSLESLRDLDYQSWQVVAYRQGAAAETAPVTLRIVGYPGRVRLDHPTPLLVRSGRRLWELADITLANPKLASDPRAAAAEFDLTPLLADLQKNRPLRLELPGVFVELPIPPYVVEEWRSLPSESAP